MKQKILLVFLGVLAIILGFYLSTRKIKTATTQPAATVTPRATAEKPPVIIIPEAPTSVSFQKPEFSAAPITLPVYSYTPLIISFTEASSLAKRFGFSDKPLKITNSGVTTYQWKKGTMVFTLDFEEDMTRISFSQPEGSLFSSSLVNNAERGVVFLKTLFSQQEGLCDIRLYKTTSGPFDGTTSTDTLTGHYYSCVAPNQHVILTSSFNTPIASLIANQEGVVREITLDTLFSVYKAEEKPILTPDEAVFYVKNNKGILISLSREKDFSFFDSPPQFTEVMLSSYSFVYYPNIKTATLDPYYVFEGTTLSDIGETLLVKYALPALVQN